MSGVMDHVSVALKIDSKLLKALDLSTPEDSVLISQLLNLSNGTGAGQASQQWSDTRPLGASATEDLDLAGVLTNAFGVTLTFTKIKLIYVKALPANTNDVQVTRPASAGAPLFMAAGDGIALSPGAVFFWFDQVGKTVTATTADLLTLTNSGGTTGVTYDILIVGVD